MLKKFFFNNIEINQFLCKTLCVWWYSPDGGQARFICWIDDILGHHALCLIINGIRSRNIQPFTVSLIDRRWALDTSSKPDFPSTGNSVIHSQISKFFMAWWYCRLLSHLYGWIYLPFHKKVGDTMFWKTTIWRCLNGRHWMLSWWLAKNDEQ